MTCCRRLILLSPHLYCNRNKLHHYHYIRRHHHTHTDTTATMDASYRSSLGRGAVTSDGEIVAMESLENIQHSVEEIFEFCAA